MGGGDLVDPEALAVMQADHQPLFDRQLCDGVAKIEALVGAAHFRRRSAKVGDLDRQPAVPDAAAHAIGAAAGHQREHPRGEPGGVLQPAKAAGGADPGVLDGVLGLIDVPQEAGRVPQEPWGPAGDQLSQGRLATGSRRCDQPLIQHCPRIASHLAAPSAL